jgi:hypothetical protein
MITQETVKQIYDCYVEISRVEQYLKYDVPHAFSVDVVVKSYLDVPGSNNTSKTIFQMEKHCVENVLKNHHANLKDMLVELNQIAKIECEMEENNVTEKN